MFKRLLIHFIFLSIIFHQLTNAQDMQIYWTDVSEKKIYRGTLDGSSYEAIVSAPRKVSVFDAEEGIFYWVENGCVNKRLMDSDTVEIVFSGVRSVTHILIDPVHQKLYWNEYDVGKIWRVNLDGEKLEEIVSDRGHPTLLTLDSEANKLYWIDELKGKIQRSNLDGSEIEDVITDASTISDFVVDGNNAAIYYLDKEAHDLNKVNIDGSDKEIVFSEIYSTNIELDPTRAKIYFDSYGGISRSNLDGTNVEELMSGFVIRIGGLNIDVKDNKLYWIDGWSNRIQRADLEGKNVKDIIINIFRAISIALNIEIKKIFWTDYDRIYCVNNDGSEIEYLTNVHCGSGGLTDIALDLYNNKIYWCNWTDCFDLSIGRSDLDGTNIDYPTSPTWQYPYGIAIDPFNGKIYWTNYFGGRHLKAIRRANLDGSDIETLVDSLLFPYDLALDLKNSKIYWTEKARMGLIRRSNLDGSDMEDVITGLDSPSGIALDVAGGKMYWAEEYAGKILRANLDGTEVEEIFTGLTAPSRIALTFENNGLTTVDEGKPTGGFIPTQFIFHQNYPNPFNPTTTLRFDLPETGLVNLRIFDVLGRQVRTLVNRKLSAGSHAVKWDGKDDHCSDAAAGLYFACLKTEGEAKSVKLLLVR